MMCMCSFSLIKNKKIVCLLGRFCSCFVIVCSFWVARYSVTGLLVLFTDELPFQTDTAAKYGRIANQNVNILTIGIKINAEIKYCTNKNLF